MRIHLQTVLCLLIVLAAREAHAQAPGAGAGKGTKQKVANPLNDLLQEARKDIDAQNFQAAIEPLQKVLAEKDDFAYAHFELAYAYTGLGRGQEARPEYEKALRLDPKMAEAALNLGILLLNDDPPAAGGALRKAVELLPAQSRPRTLLGLAYEKAGDFENATSAYEGALGLDPKDAETSMRLAQLYFRQNRTRDAEAKFRAVLAADPESRVALMGLAESLEQEKRPEAIEAYQNYLR